MSDSVRTGLDDLNQPARRPAEPHMPVAGSPLPAGTGESAPLPPDDSQRSKSTPPPPARELAQPAQPVSRAGQSSGLQRAVGAVRMVLPLVQKVLPLLDGNIASAVSNILTLRPQAPPRSVDLAPVDKALAKLHFEQHELRSQVAEQSASLSRVADQVKLVRDATNRNTLKQQELTKTLESIQKKAKVFAWVVLGLLAISILVNAILFLRIQRLLP
jgi:hypothetical protein